MPDDNAKWGSQSRRRVNINENYELRYWTKKFGVSEDELKAAVSKVGPIADAVERELKKSAA
jgi:hypothetical protein